MVIKEEMGMVSKTDESAVTKEVWSGVYMRSLMVAYDSVVN